MKKPEWLEKLLYTDELQREVVPFERAISLMNSKINRLDSRKRNIIAGVLVYELIAGIRMKDLERVGLLEQTKLNILK